jgi:hypothetical protein
VRRPFDLQHGVADLPAQCGQLFLQLRLVVDVCRRGVFDAAAERLDDRFLDRLEAVLEEQRSKGGLEQRGENVAVSREAVELLGRDDSLALLRKQRAEPELTGNDGAARARNDVRADLRQPALGQIGEALVERPGDRELEDAVAEKLQPLVRGRPVGRPRGMRECVFRPLGGQLGDQPRKTAGLGVLSLATGAT